MSKTTATKPILLIVEDDAGLQSQFRWNFDQYVTVVADNRQDAIAAMKASLSKQEEVKHG